MNFFQAMWQLARQGESEGIFFWVALYALAMGLYSLAFQLRTRRWPVTKGHLTSAEVKKFGATDPVLSEQDYISSALYKYNVSGVEYEGKRISPWVIVASHNARMILEKQLSHIQRHADGTVSVHYNPGNPKKSFLVAAGRVGIGITLALSVMPIVGFYIKYYS